MATTTTNNAWSIPTATDLVKNGYSAIATLGSAIDTSVGTGLLAWTAYTPTWGGFGVGNATQTWNYAKVGKIVHVRGRVVMGSTSTFAGSLTFSLPATANSGYVQFQPIGAVYIGDVSASQPYSGFTFWNSTTTIGMNVGNSAGTYTVPNNVTSAVPMTWAVSDQIYISFTYEAA